MSITLIDLPHEVILIIISSLEKKDHIQLRTVCQHLNIILQPFVFNTVSIIDGSTCIHDLTTSLTCFMNNNKNNNNGTQPIGHYIQQLSLLDDMTTIDDLIQLPLLCPNIKNICISYSILANINEQEQPASTIALESDLMNNDNNNNDDDDDDDIYKTHPSIRQFMTSMMQPHLKSVKFKYFLFNYHILIHDILPYLSHLTHLDLGLSKGCMGTVGSYNYCNHREIGLFELIQQHCPQLEYLQCPLIGYSKQELVLKSYNLHKASSERKEAILETWILTIQPWTSLKTISVACNYKPFDMRFFLLYLSVKAKHINKLSISNSMLYSNQLPADQQAPLLTENYAKVFTFSSLRSIQLDCVTLLEHDYSILYSFNKYQYPSITTSSTPLSLLSSPPTGIAKTGTLENITLRHCMNERHNTPLIISFYDQLLSFHKSLTSLEIKDPHIPFSQIIDNIRIGQCNSITSLTLSDIHCQSSSKLSVYNILSKFINLNYLKIDAIPIETGPPAPFLNTNDRDNPFVHFDHPLQHLHLQHINNMNPQTFQQLSYLCRQLSTLCLNSISFSISSGLNIPPAAAPLFGDYDSNEENIIKYQQHRSLLDDFYTSSNPKKVIICISLPWTSLKECIIVGPISKVGARFRSISCWYLLQQSSIPMTLYDNYLSQQEQHHQQQDENEKKKSTDQYNFYWHNDGCFRRLNDFEQYDQEDTFKILKKVTRKDTDTDIKDSIISKEKFSTLKKTGLISIQCKKLSSIQFLSSGSVVY
ncbi:hypothetical protein BJ944DRAFT_261257 [Cunninghamella echinulata]|nr:hypothetical protein BJ944DRAFT_261257 [Cunninghamella echinulata]